MTREGAPRENAPAARGTMSRRGLLGAAATAAGVAAAGPLLSGCGSKKSKGPAATSQSDIAKLMPAYVPNTSLKPDIPSVTGANGAMSDPVFLSYPTNPVSTVQGTPGKGGSYTTMTPLWGAIPPSSGNTYYDAVNQALGATLKMQPSDGNNYGNNLPPLFAANKLPDWICIPGWNTTTLSFGNGVGKYFVDLGPYLSGDAVKQYPNLATIPTSAWAAGVWNGHLYGIPVYPVGANINGTYFYRADLFAQAGIDPSTIKTPDDLGALGKELTNANAGHWAFDDLIGDDGSYAYQPFKFPAKWGTDSSGKLIHKYETEGIVEALNWSAKLAKAGYIHPDAMANTNQNAKQRFWSGKSAVTADGTGAWVGDDAKSGTAANPSYRRMAFKLMSVSGTPTVEIRPSAGIFSYINKSLSDAQIKEVLAIANYLAAPYGSAEWLTVNYGKAGVDYTMTNGNPLYTQQGSKEVATTFQFLVTTVTPTTVQSGFVQVAKDVAAWQADMVKYAVKPMFFGMNITEPAQYASIGQPVVDTMVDVKYGRKPISAFQDAVKTWKSAGGEALRAFYEDVRNKYGTGQ